MFACPGTSQARRLLQENWSAVDGKRAHITGAETCQNQQRDPRPAAADSDAGLAAGLSSGQRMDGHQAKHESNTRQPTLQMKLSMQPPRPKLGEILLSGVGSSPTEAVASWQPPGCSEHSDAYSIIFPGRACTLQANKLPNQGLFFPTCSCI